VLPGGIVGAGALGLADSVVPIGTGVAGFVSCVAIGKPTVATGPVSAAGITHKVVVCARVKVAKVTSTASARRNPFLTRFLVVPEGAARSAGDHRTALLSVVLSANCVRPDYLAQPGESAIPAYFARRVTGGQPMKDG
jgi:hypothetical protein